MKTLTIYADTGHAWGKVSLKFIKQAGIQNRISGFSYMSKEHAFLEEDCDVQYAFDAMRDINGCDPKVVVHNGNKQSRIRNYSSYNPANIDWNACRVKGQ